MGIRDIQRKIKLDEEMKKKAMELKASITITRIAR